MTFVLENNLLKYATIESFNERWQLLFRVGVPVVMLSRGSPSRVSLFAHFFQHMNL